MELREFAERVLFATTLEEKLQSPDAISDEHPGSSIAAPAMPDRPAGLQFKSQASAKSEFPGLGALEHESERGRLLHFFANHELLATELMALVLLRFPDAPAAFRRGVLQTLKDEQEHTRLYIERMRACGIEFGELPVSGYFWRAVSGMENPIDYVAGLSLTFEQANLDFARHFATGFGKVGDTDTAALLEKIYRDEIMHVAYGLKWFRRWKNPNESDWEAFCRQLKYPLSPQRAKGIALNVEGRKAAGLDAQFIAELDVFSQSKGRTPSVFVFNPFAEGCIAHGRGFTPAKHQAQLARDLENLPQFLGRQDDVVLVQRRPSVEFLSTLKQAGFALPEFVELGGDPARALEELAQRKLGRLRPWAWGPDSGELFAPLSRSVAAEERSADQRFNGGIAELYSKAWSSAFFRRWLSSLPASDWLCGENEVGVVVNNFDRALEVIAAIRGRGHHRIVVKEALGLAGSNAIRLWEPELLDSQRRWMTAAFERGRTLVIEPWLERELDFSAQLEMGDDGLKLCGFTGLINDRKGQFEANVASPNFARQVPATVLALLGSRATPPQVHELFHQLFAALEIEFNRAGFRGPIGIDALVYRDAHGNARLKPLVEINPRYTMGRLTLELMKQVAPGSHGRFSLVNRAKLKAAGCDDFLAFVEQARRSHPVCLEGQPRPRIREGFVCLNDPSTTQVCLAVFEVTRAAKVKHGADCSAPC